MRNIILKRLLDVWNDRAAEAYMPFIEVTKLSNEDLLDFYIEMCWS